MATTPPGGHDGSAHPYVVPPGPRPVGLAAAGIAVVAVIGQILLARMLGTLDWGGCFCDGRAEAWSPTLTAQLWFTASSVVMAALLARRLLAQGTLPSNQAEYFTAVVPPAAAVMFAVPLVVALAAGADSPRALPAGIDVGISVPLGAVLGALTASAIFAVPRLIRPMWFHVAWIWLLGLLSVVMSWGDNVGQTVPIGSILIGGPGPNATPGDQTLHDITESALTVIALLGPAVIGGWLAWLARSAGSRLGLAILVGAVGPLFAFATYLFRPDAISGDNIDGFQLALETLILAAVGAAGALLGYSLWNQPVAPHDPEYQSRHRE